MLNNVLNLWMKTCYHLTLIFLTIFEAFNFAVGNYILFLWNLLIAYVFHKVFNKVKKTFYT
jgi:IS4 transposase